MSSGVDVVDGLGRLRSWRSPLSEVRAFEIHEVVALWFKALAIRVQTKRFVIYFAAAHDSQSLGVRGYPNAKAVATALCIPVVQERSVAASKEITGVWFGPRLPTF